MLKSIRAFVFVRCRAGGRFWEGPLWEAPLYTFSFPKITIRLVVKINLGINLFVPHKNEIKTQLNKIKLDLYIIFSFPKK